MAVNSWTWDFVSAYRLSARTLEAYLHKLFPEIQDPNLTIERAEITEARDGVFRDEGFFTKLNETAEEGVAGRSKSTKGSRRKQTPVSVSELRHEQSNTAEHVSLRPFAHYKQEESTPPPDIPFVQANAEGHVLLPSKYPAAVELDQPDWLDAFKIVGTSTVDVTSETIDEKEHDTRLRHALYNHEFSSGESSQVFGAEIKPLSALSESSGSLNELFRATVKVAIKRLRLEKCSKSDFLREHAALTATKKLAHPNIVECISTFCTRESTASVPYYNFVFPRALGNLKQLYRGDSCMRPIRLRVEDLWSQYEGLASALQHLHEDCYLGHADLKASNILVYLTDGEPAISLKITDFGLAVDLNHVKTWTLGTEEKISAVQYDAPELRQHYERWQDSIANTSAPLRNHDLPSADQIRKGDVWKLGCIFTELSTFIIGGKSLVKEFRHFITTTVRRITTDDFYDVRFDDGVQVKAEVLEWIAKLTKGSDQVRDIQTLLNTMLEEERKRPTASEVAARLRDSILCIYLDPSGPRLVHFRDEHQSPRLSIFDRVKGAIEDLLGQPIDWWPLSNGLRQIPAGHTRLQWMLNERDLFADVLSSSALQYRSACQRIASITSPSPVWNPTRQHPSPAGTENAEGSAVYYAPLRAPPAVALPTPLGPSHTNSRGSWAGRTGISTPLQAFTQRASGASPEIYWCVDKSWTQPTETRVCSVSLGSFIADDNELCSEFLRHYLRVRGEAARIFSWKTCLGIAFIRFSPVFAGMDHVVETDRNLPQHNPGIWEYQLVQPKDAHMKIAAAQIISIMHKPSRTRGSQSTINMIPKRINGPLALQIDSEGWGLRAIQGFSLSKILIWIGVLFTAGFAFAILWLILIDKTDLQNAFIPFMILAIGLTTGLAVPQALNVA